MNPEPSDALSQAATAGLKDYFRKKFPFKGERKFKPAEWQALGRKYKRMKVVTSIIAMLQFFGMPVASGWLFYRLYLLLGNSILSAHDVFYPATWAMFIIPGFFFGLSTINTVSTFFQKLLFGSSYRDLEYYHNVTEGYDNDSTFLFISRMLLIPFFITLVMAMTTMLVTSQDGFRHKGYLSLMPARHRYSDVEKVTFYDGFVNKKKEQRIDHHFFVFFKDGSTLPTNWYFDDAEATIPFVEALKRKGIHVDSAVIDNN